MLPRDKERMEEIDVPYNKFFVPCVWAANVVAMARRQGRIKDDFAVQTLIDVNKSDILFPRLISLAFKLL